jgi:hypothetical protein
MGYEQDTFRRLVDSGEIQIIEWSSYEDTTPYASGENDWHRETLIEVIPATPLSEKIARFRDGSNALEVLENPSTPFVCSYKNYRPLEQSFKQEIENRNWKIKNDEELRKRRSESARKAADTRKKNKVLREQAKERAKTLIKRSR